MKCYQCDKACDGSRKEIFTIAYGGPDAGCEEFGDDGYSEEERPMCEDCHYEDEARMNQFLAEHGIFPGSVEG